MDTTSITPPPESHHAFDSLLRALAAHGFGLPGASPSGNRGALASALVDAQQDDVRVQIHDQRRAR